MEGDGIRWSAQCGCKRMRWAHGKLLGILVLCDVSQRTETNRSREWLDSENRGLCVISSETGIWGRPGRPGLPGLHAEKDCTADASCWWFSRLVELAQLCAAPGGILRERCNDGRGGLCLPIFRNRWGRDLSVCVRVCVCRCVVYVRMCVLYLIEEGGWGRVAGWVVAEDGRIGR